MKGIGVAFTFLETSYNTGLFIGMGIVFIYGFEGEGDHLHLLLSMWYSSLPIRYLLFLSL